MGLQKKGLIIFVLFCIFIDYEVFGQTNRESVLINAIQNQNISLLKENIDSGNLDLPFSDGRGNALFHAVQMEAPRAVEYLLSVKANPDGLLHSRTPLMYAVQQNNVSIVRLLLKYRAHINAKDSLGNTALMIAAAGSRLNYARILLRKGASLNDRNIKGYNARDLAVRSNDRAIAAFLRNKFENNLPDYFDGPYVAFVGKKRLKVSYFKHDSLHHRSDALVRFLKLKDLNNELHGLYGDSCVYPLSSRFERPATEINNVKKLLIIGDIHGQFDTLRTFLQNNKIIDRQLHWSFGNGTVVFDGDIFDRGEKVTEALWLIYRLEKEAVKYGGAVNLLLGNHELMELHDDTRYISEKYYYLFKNLKINYSRYYSNKTVLGRWIRSRNTFLKVDSFLFVHGGVHPNILQYNLSIDSMNLLVNKYLNYKRKSILNNNALQFLIGYDGPFWYRGMVEQTADNAITDEALNRILAEFKVKHIIVGHTFRPKISVFNNGKIISTDVPFYLPDGYPMQALLLEDQKFVLLNSKGEKREFNLQ